MNRQRGVALLLSLGVLSLLLVSGIAFVAGALHSQRAAAAYRFRTQSQLLGKSSVNRVMMLMRYYLQQGDAEGIGDLKSTINSEAFANASDVPDAGKNDQLAAGVDSLLTAAVDNSVRNAPAAQWEYLWDAYDGTGKRTADANLLGRFAYWVLPAGSVNFSEILRGNTALSTGSLSTWTKRRGFGIRELNLGSSTYITNANLNLLDDRFSAETFSATAQDSARANDYQTFQSMFDGQTTLALTERNVIRRFLPPSGTEEEVFLHTASYDKTAFNPNRADSVTRYHRFDLTRTDWDKLGNTTEIPNSDTLVLRLLGEGMTLKERAAGDAVTETTEVTADSIPALRRVGDTQAAYPTLTLRRKQIAANLIDYCDTDSVPTSDSTNWETTAPNYTGNEKTPYINEIMVSPSIAIRREEITIPGGGETPTQYQYRYTGQIGLRLAAAEVVNIYEASAFPGLNMSLEGEYTVEVSADKDKGAEALRTQSFTVKFAIPFEATTTTWTVPDSLGRYAVKTLYADGAPATVVITTEPAAGWAEFTSVESTTQLTEGLAVSARITKLKISKIHLKTASASIDYVRDLEFTPAETGGALLDDLMIATSATSPCDVTLYPHLGCEVDDPRENLYQGSKTEENAMNWKLIKVSAAAGTASDAPPANFNSTTAFSFGLQNNFCRPANDGTNAAKDLETATRPENVSSVHLRDNAMKTLVELGAIPRGAKWETLNLRASRVTPATAVTPDLEEAGDTYQQGDAAILDQVKLTARVQVPHRLCINTPPGKDTPESKLLYAGLFRGLVWNWDKHYHYEYAGTALTNAEAESAGNVLADRDVAADSGAQKFFSRAELVNFAPDGKVLWKAYSDSIAPTTDAQAETIPVLVSSLISFFPRSPDPVTLILVAQSIRDIGTPAGFSMTKLKSDGSADTVTRDVKSGQFDLENGVYFDEITGTVRYYAEIGTDAMNKKVRLLRLEPLD